MASLGQIQDVVERFEKLEEEVAAQGMAIRVLVSVLGDMDPRIIERLYPKIKQAHEGKPGSTAEQITALKKIEPLTMGILNFAIGEKG